MIKISKDGLREHYEHVNRIRKEHGAIPIKAVREIGNRTLREAKMLATERTKRRPYGWAAITGKTYKGSLNVQFLKDGSNDVAVIGSWIEYAPHLEYGTPKHIIRPKRPGGVLAWRSNRFSSLKTGKERTTKVLSHVTPKGNRKYKNMVFTPIVHHPGTKPLWILRDAIFNIAPLHIPIIMQYLGKPVK